MTYYYDLASITFYDPYDYYQVIARTVNSCGPTNWRIKQIAVSGGYYFPIYIIPKNQILFPGQEVVLYHN